MNMAFEWAGAGQYVLGQEINLMSKTPSTLSYALLLLALLFI